MYLFSSLSILAATATLASAQYPATPSGLTVVKSKVDPKVTISFKETEICPQPAGSKIYSGYVHLPGSVLADVGGYDINSYFLYFEARNNPSTAPLAIYLAGGPGESSTYAALSSESGPCYVDPSGQTTITNPWSFNENANLLYIDQPVQSGFSYSNTLINATSDLLTGLIEPLDSSTPPTVNASLGYGTYAAQNFHQTANLTVGAGKALWHFAEHWLSSFPGYSTSSDKISVWGNSYGGFWVPETAARFSRNFKTLPADHPLKQKCPVIDAIGVTNAEIDLESSVTGWPQYAYNNTYGVRFGSEKQYDKALDNINKAGGCLDLIAKCRTLGEAADSDFSGANSTVNAVCMEAFGSCAESAIEAFPKINKRDPFDIAQPSSQPCPYWLPVNTYLNTGSVQQSLGVPLNFSVTSNVVLANFGLPSAYTNRPISKQTGDSARQNGLPDIEYLIANNVKVAFIYGDRDFRCPWTGGQATALAVKWTHQQDFATAGFTELQGSTKKGTDHGAVVKQYENFSFSRVFDSGHSVSAYAPETVFRIFDRTLQGLDVATGKELASSGYHTDGPSESWSWRNTLPRKTPLTCIVEGQFTKQNPWADVIGGS